jgi:hypothetical protein
MRRTREAAGEGRAPEGCPMKPLDLGLLFSSGALEGPHRRPGWFRQLIDFLTADEPDLSTNN